MRQEVRDVVQTIAELAVHVAAVVHRMHLVNPHARESCRPGLKRIEQTDRFPVGQRHDDVAAGAHVAKYCVRIGRFKEIRNGFILTDGSARSAEPEDQVAERLESRY